MKKISKQLMFLLCFQHTILLTAQTNLVKGYVINLQNDTVKGFIDYLDWKVSPKKVSFYENTTDKAVEFKPDTIKGFGLENGAFYESANVRYLLKTEDIAKINRSKPSEIEEKLFLERLLVGKINLYKHYNSNSVYNFFIKYNNGLIEELIDYKIVNSSSNIQEFMIFKSQLLKIVDNTCAKAIEKIHKSNYKVGDLYDIISLWNNGCEGTKTFTKSKNDKVLITGGFFLGITSTDLIFQGIAKPTLSQINFPRHIFPTLGVEIGFKLPGKLHTVSINNELAYRRYKTQGSIDYTKINYYKHDYLFDMTYIRYNLLLRKSFLPTKIIKPFIQAGLSLGYVVKYVNQENIFSKFPSTEYNETIEAVKMRKIEQGYMFGLGAEYKRWNVSLRYEVTNGFSNFTQLNSITKDIGFRVGYSILGSVPK